MDSAIQTINNLSETLEGCCITFTGRKKGNVVVKGLSWGEKTEERKVEEFFLKWL